MDKTKAAPDSIMALMEQMAANSGDNGEEVLEMFQCSVCLDLLYKPVVLACGHISCFWCVHRAMSGLRESRCAICRRPYHHFPSICQLLHSLLLKIYPVTYKRRGKQVLEEEKISDVFSPEFGDHLTTESVCTSNELDLLGCSSDSSSSCFSQANSCPDPCSIEQSNFCIILVPSEQNTSFHNTATVSEKSHVEILDDIRNVDGEKNKFPDNSLMNGTCKHVSTTDVLCAACKQLLFQPAVLNCGHVYCESCLVKPVNEILKCQVCQSTHPGGFPNVCLELCHFLEEQFSKEYALRREAVHLKQVHYQHESPSPCAAHIEKQDADLSPWPIKKDFSWWNKYASKVHVRVGCDLCGMYPIIGKRYSCKDCVEVIGFDLCESCYDSRSKLPGRFNQQHTPEHKVELVPLRMSPRLLLRIVAEMSEHGPAASPSPLPDDAPEE